MIEMDTTEKLARIFLDVLHERGYRIVHADDINRGKGEVQVITQAVEGRDSK